MISLPPTATLFPYTTLFRSRPARRGPPRARGGGGGGGLRAPRRAREQRVVLLRDALRLDRRARVGDRKSTRLNSSHVEISYVVFCLKKKKHRCKITSYYGGC